MGIQGMICGNLFRRLRRSKASSKDHTTENGEETSPSGSRVRSPAQQLFRRLRRSTKASNHTTENGQKRPPSTSSRKRTISTASQKTTTSINSQKRDSTGSQKVASSITSPGKTSSPTKESIAKKLLTVDAVDDHQLNKKHHTVGGESTHESHATFAIERLPRPTKSSTDRNIYSVIRLSNGVVATIVAEGQDNTVAGPSRELNEFKPNLKECSSAKIGSELKVLRRELSYEPSNLGVARSSMQGNPFKEDELERNFNLTPAQALAACAVTVEVGSFNDPENIPGLCHLLEHVLSMGSDKFKGEDEFDAFLGQNGGSYDAETETEYMTFYFECQDTCLYAAMEMFSRFFVAPLMRWDSIRRERLAVASEFAEQSNSDNARRMQIICMSANTNNPAKKFTWGNLKTLKDNIGEIQLLSALNQFRETYFTGDRVKVAVQAKLPVETLEGWVNLLFSSIPKRSANLEVPKHLANPFDKSKFCRLYKVQSVGDICDVNINWALPPVCTKYRTKPLDYLSYAIGAEGEGSLSSYLRGQRMALYLTSEVEEGGLVSNSLYTIFTVSIALTEEGRRDVRAVIKSVFGYLAMLRTKGPSQQIWSELQDIAEISFKYKRIERPSENVRLITQGMTMFPPKDYLTGWTKFFEFSGEEILLYLLEMTPENANILVHMKNHEQALNKEERWFKTKYKVDDIPSSWIQEWNAAEPEKSFHLPASNPYIADDFGLQDRENKEGYPRKVIETKSYELWHKGDEHFNRPYATVNILLGTPHLTAQNIVCQMLFAKLFIYQMIDVLYFAQVAHIEHKMASTEYGLEISIHGISQKIPNVLKEVALGLVAFKNKEEVQRHMIKYLKVVLERNIVNTLANGASLIEDIRKSVCSSLTFTGGEKYPYVRAINQEDVDAYWQEMLENVNVTALVQGNISTNKAKEIVEEFVNILHGTWKDHAVAQPLARMIPTGESIVSIAAFNPQEENCYTQYYYQFGPGSIVESVAVELFVATMGEPLFDELRTKEQLGYSVSVTMSEILGVIGVIITINSQITRHSPEYIRTRVDTFVKDYLKYFKVLTKPEFDNAKNVFLALKQMKPGTLKEESSKNWWEIKNRGEFDRSSKEIEAIAKLDKKGVVKVVERTMDFSKSNINARKLVLQVIGYKPEIEAEDDERSAIVDGVVIYRSANTEAYTPASKVVKDVLAWKNSLPTYKQ